MTDVATTGSNLPAAYTPQVANEISAEDIALPRIKVAHSSSQLAQDGLVRMGQIFAAFGRDDNDPTVLYDPKDKDAKGVLFHVLDLRKGWSLNTDDGFQTWADNDPSRPDESWRTYDYVLCLPEVDAELPYKFLFTKSAKGQAQKINLQLKRAAVAGPHTLAWRVTTAERSNEKGRWYVPQVKSEPATAENIAAAEALLEMVASAPAPAASVGPAPAI